MGTFYLPVGKKWNFICRSCNLILPNGEKYRRSKGEGDNFFGICRGCASIRHDVRNISDSGNTDTGDIRPLI